MSKILLLCSPMQEPEGLVHVAICDTETPWNYAVICDGTRFGMATVSQKDNTPTCLQCIAKQPFL